MSPFLLYFLIGLAAGIPIFIIGLLIRNMFKNTLERRAIKKMIKQRRFLTPIDTKDFDKEMWKEYILINPEEIKNFNKKIFKEEYEEIKIIKLAMEYITKVRKLGFDDDKIREEFRKKNYPEELINKFFKLENGQTKTEN